VTRPRSRRARRSNPPVAYGFHYGRRHLDLPNGIALRGVVSEVDLGWREKTRGDPSLAPTRAGDPGARGATRRARATSSKSAQLAFTRALRSAICPVHASGTRRAQAVACRSWLAGFLMRQRIARPTQPASVGAGEQRGESLTRVRGSNARRVCPRVVSVAEVGERRRGPEKRESRWQRAAWTGARPTRIRKAPGG
jgi:hypothetical protein